MNNKPTSPSHRIYAVTRYGQQRYWRPIGAAWAHGDGEGFNLKLDYLPLNGAEIVIRKPTPGADDADASPDAKRNFKLREPKKIRDGRPSQT